MRTHSITILKYNIYLLQRREFPDGTVKIVYPDGTRETRYPDGRVRIKDFDGNLISDTYTT